MFVCQPFFSGWDPYDHYPWCIGPYRYRDFTLQKPLSAPDPFPCKGATPSPLPPRHVQTSSLWSTHGWQASSWHSIGMLSCLKWWYFYNAVSSPQKPIQNSFLYSTLTNLTDANRVHTDTFRPSFQLSNIKCEKPANHHPDPARLTLQEYQIILTTLKSFRFGVIMVVYGKIYFGVIVKKKKCRTIIIPHKKNWH